MPASCLHTLLAAPAPYCENLSTETGHVTGCCSARHDFESVQTMFHLTQASLICLDSKRLTCQHNSQQLLHLASMNAFGFSMILIERQ